MPRICCTVEILRPIDAVYGYATTPINWLQWHPSSVSVSGAVDHPLAIGEEVTEAFTVAGRSGKVVWTVTECSPPRRWAIAGTVAGGGRGTISYALEPRHNGTRFRREFVYEMSSLLGVVLDRFFVRKRIQAESVTALANLKRILEA